MLGQFGRAIALNEHCSGVSKLGEPLLQIRMILHKHDKRNEILMNLIQTVKKGWVWGLKLGGFPGFFSIEKGGPKSFSIEKSGVKKFSHRKF